jgi:hypothetical protein
MYAQIAWGRAAISLATLLASAVCMADGGAAPCPTTIDHTRLQLDYGTFDAQGWRDLLANDCIDAALSLLSAYRDANRDIMTADQLREISFHAGQALAFGGRDAESIPYFERARSADATEEWSAYVEATLAFLHRDGAILAAQRVRYAAAPGAAAMRLSIIDGFIACSDSPYSEAVHCAMNIGH